MAHDKAGIMALLQHAMALQTEEALGIVAFDAYEYSLVTEPLDEAFIHGVLELAQVVARLQTPDANFLIPLLCIEPHTCSQALTEEIVRVIRACYSQSVDENICVVGLDVLFHLLDSEPLLDILHAFASLPAPTPRAMTAYGIALASLRALDDAQQRRLQALLSQLCADTDAHVAARATSYAAVCGQSRVKTVNPIST